MRSHAILTFGTDGQGVAYDAVREANGLMEWAEMLDFVGGYRARGGLGLRAASRGGEDIDSRRDRLALEGLRRGLIRSRSNR